MKDVSEEILKKYVKSFFDAVRIMRNEPNSNLAKYLNTLFDIHEIVAKHGNSSEEHEDYLETIDDNVWWRFTEDERKRLQLFSATLNWIQDNFAEEGDKSEKTDSSINQQGAN